MNDLSPLHTIVEQAFKRATAQPDIARWNSCSVVAGCAAARLAVDGDACMAACMEGVAEEARRQRAEMLSQREEIAA